MAAMIVDNQRMCFLHVVFQLLFLFIVNPQLFMECHLWPRQPIVVDVSAAVPDYIIGFELPIRRRCSRSRVVRRILDGGRCSNPCQDATGCQNSQGGRIQRNATILNCHDRQSTGGQVKHSKGSFLSRIPLCLRWQANRGRTNSQCRCFVDSLILLPTWVPT